MRVRFMLSAGLLAATTCLHAFSATLNLPAPSMWKLNTSKSDFGTMPGPASETLTISAYSPSLFTWVQDIVTPDGRKLETAWSGPMDGTPQPMTGVQGAKASFKEDTARFEYPNGMVGEATFSLSPDGKTLTESVIYSAGGKKAHQTHVYDLAK